MIVLREMLPKFSSHFPRKVCLVVILNYMYNVIILMDVIDTPKSHKYPGSTPHSGNFAPHYECFGTDYSNHFSSSSEE